MTEESTGPRERRIALAVGIIAFGAYAFFFGGSGFNQNATLDQARAIVEQHTLAITAYASNTADLSEHNGQLYPNKAPGTSFLAVIPYAILYPIERAAGAAFGTVPLLTLNLYVVTVAVCGTLGAVIAAAMFIAARRRGASARRAIAISFLTAFGTPLFAYATMLFLHVPSTAFLLLAHLAVFYAARPRPVAAGLAAGAAGLTNYLCIPVALILGIALLVRSKNRVRDALLYAAGGLPGAALLSWYHYRAFGGPFSLPIESENPAFLDKDAFLGIMNMPRADALWGVTFSPYRGLFFLSPLLLLAIVGLFRMRPRLEAVTIAAVSAFFLLFNASFNGWHGGYAIGPRYITPIIPLLALGLVYVPWKAVLGLLGAVSMAMNLIATAVDPQPPDSVMNPIRDYALPLLVYGAVPEGRPIPDWLRQLYTGNVAVNRVAADEVLPFRRHEVGSAASEWASFNLGEAIFTQGHWTSLLPVLLWMFGGWWWLDRRARSVGHVPLVTLQ